jgi:hypothetical protein
MVDASGRCNQQPTEQAAKQPVKRGSFAFIFSLILLILFFPACVLRYLFNGPLTTIMTSSAAHRRATYVGRFFVFFFIGLCGCVRRSLEGFSFSRRDKVFHISKREREKMTGLLLSRAESIRARRKMKEIRPLAASLISIFQTQMDWSSR